MSILANKKFSKVIISLKDVTLKEVIVNYVWIPTLLVNYVFILFNTFYRQKNYLEIWSFKLIDYPYMANNLEPQPILYGHYFGDYQLPLSYLSLGNIYDNSQLLPNGGIPSGTAILYFFNLFEIKSGLIILFFISLTLVLIQLLKVKSPKTLISLLIISSSMPLFSAFDRGNFISISVFTFGLALVYIDKKQSMYRLLTIILIVISVSLKIYLVVALLLLMLVHKKRVTLNVIITLIILNSILLLISNYSLSQVIEANSIGSEVQYTRELLLEGVGPLSTTFQFINYFSNFNLQLDFLYGYAKELHILYVLVFLILSFLILINKSVFNREKKAIIMSTFMFAPPLANVYVLIWTIPALIFLIENDLAKKVSDVSKRQLVLIVGCVLTLIPWSHTNFKSFYSIIWLSILLGINFTLYKKRILTRIFNKQ